MIYTIRKFDQDGFDEFSEKINSLKDWEKVKIFIDTNGGSVNVKDMYLEIISSIENIEVIWSVLYSVGFTMFNELNCPKKLILSAYGMVHHEAWSTDVWYGGIARGDQDKFQLEYYKNKKCPVYEWMTPEQKERYENWYDIFLDYEGLKKAFNL